MKPLKTNSNYSFLPIEESKPCIFLGKPFPDFRRRMYLSNLLTKITQDIRAKLNEIEIKFHENDYRTAVAESEALIGETLFTLRATCDKFIDIVSNYKMADDTVLDREKLKMSVNEMTHIKYLLNSVYELKNKRKRFQKLDKFCSKLEALLSHVEDWPRVYLWMIHGKKRVAFYTTETKNIVYSMVDEERGQCCGIYQTIFLQTSCGDENSVSIETTACKMDLYLWMGLYRHWENFSKTLPESFLTSSEPIPRTLIAKEYYTFECKAYIFQGQFSPGSDKSGLCDPFVQVMVNGQGRETQVLKKTLNPIWDQTLTFNQIILYGSKDFIKNHPPTVLMDVYDKDEFFKTEVLGRALLHPRVTLLNENNLLPKLQWCSLRNKNNASAKVLAAVELTETTPKSDEDKKTVVDDQPVVQIPNEIKPILVTYKIEVFFWGMRELKSVQAMAIRKPKIVVECGNSLVTSDTLVNVKKNLNFTNPVKYFEVVFPEQAEYAPPFLLKLFDCRHFGINVFAGTYISSVNDHLYVPMSAEDRNRKLYLPEVEEKLEKGKSLESVSVESVISIVKSHSQGAQKSKSKKDKFKYLKKINIKKWCKSLKCGRKGNSGENDTYDDEDQNVEDTDFDWWTKFYASLEEKTDENEINSPKNSKLKIYSSDLESQPEFEYFRDVSLSFPIYKGKKTGDDAVDEENTLAIFKGCLKIYRWPPICENPVTLSGSPLSDGVFQDFPDNGVLRYILRIYCVRAIGLRPKDLNGKSDPYISIRLNKQVINDKEHRVMRQVNPVFGKCYELNGLFPQDNTLVIAVYDWDMASADDLIGETKVDLENRYYSRHRANCGLSETYQEHGYCQWRDQHRPASILESLCKKWKIPEPVYSATSVRILFNEFRPEKFTPSGSFEIDKQVLALYALRRWQQVHVVGCHLVPEHVETRSLFNPNKPGIEQGKLQIWIDILLQTDLPPPPSVDISPRKPTAYELRVIVWNVENVQMNEDDFFTGEKKSDIYVKGWLTGPENAQYTDIHYRSLSGEGNFNWRFVFSFEYLSTENKLVIRKKESIFALDETEFKLPCRLYLQVWDNDSFSMDDFLGSLVLELSKLPRGARSSKSCSLEILQPPNPTLNLFKARRTKGWWPFRSVNPVNKKEIFAGSVEIELELLPQEVAEMSPAGLGRDQPQGLSPPKRPDTSFSWFKNPLKACKFVIKLNKWKMILVTASVCLVLLIGLAFWAFPGYLVKKILNV